MGHSDISQENQDIEDWKKFNDISTEWQDKKRIRETKLKELFGSEVSASYKEVADDLVICITNIHETYKFRSWTLDYESAKKGICYLVFKKLMKKSQAFKIY